MVLVWAVQGSTSYISPTLEITQTGEKHTIDGVEIELQLTPGTEAPAEMNFGLDRKMLCGWLKTVLERSTTCIHLRSPGT